jgi:hypothetical protein
MRPIVSTNTLIGWVVAFVLGLFVGLVVLGWWLTPVEYINTDFKKLSAANQSKYVKLVADAYAGTGAGNVDKAKAALAELGDPPGALQTALGDSTGTDSQAVNLLSAATGIVPAAPAQQGGGLLQTLVPLCATVIFLAVAVGGAFFFLRMRGGGAPAAPKAAGRTSGASYSTAPSTTIPPSEMTFAPGEEPVSTFKTTYMLGNDLFDESFSVDDQSGDFLGECGVGISETIGVGDPKKVTAFEVWLFDKNDIRTVTRVLMSEHAFRDEALKSKLSAKGEPALARTGEVVKMETATLKVEARIVDMQYGSGPLPPNSFFQQITLEIAAWKKAA